MSPEISGPGSEQDSRWSHDKAWDVAHAPEVKDRIDYATEKGADYEAKEAAFKELNEQHTADPHSVAPGEMGRLRQVVGQSQALSDEANYQRNSLIEMEGKEFDAKSHK